MKKETWIIALIFLAVIGGAAFFLYKDYQKQNQHDINSMHEGSTGSAYKEVTYNGEQYKFNPRLDTFLYIGVDSREGLQSGESDYAGRSDAIMLFVLNKDTKGLTVISISRDTMTEIESFDYEGNSLGMIEQHLGYAYMFAGGGKKSCESVCNAVSRLLGGIPIEEYFATDISSIADINDIVGGVTVVSPNDDLIEVDSAMAKGNQVTLTADNVEKFLRYRDTTVDFSNNGRLERQRVYINAYMPKLKQELAHNLNGVWDKFLTFEENTVTSITRNEYLSIANEFAEMDLGAIEFYSPEGQDQLGERHDEFYVDEDALRQKVLEIFYLKDGSSK